MAVEQELLLLSFDNNITDAAGRHTLTNSGVTFSPDCKVGANSAYFNGSSYLQSSDNLIDFNLGATLFYSAFSSGGWTPAYANNNFTIDCWVKPETGGARYYPICASGQVYYFGGGYKVGWALQIDTATGKLQMIGHAGGDWAGSLLESTFLIPFGEWTHIAVMSWLMPQGFETLSAKAMYKNGQPDLGGWSTQSSYMTWANSMMHSNGGIESAPFCVGRGFRSQYTTPGEAWGDDINLFPGFLFRGWIDNLRICRGSRFPNGDSLIQVAPFTPPGVETTTTTTTTTTESTTTTTFTVTTQSTTTVTLTSTTTTTTTTASTTAPPFPVIPDGSTNESVADCMPQMLSNTAPVPSVVTSSSENIPGQGIAPPWGPAYFAFDNNEKQVVGDKIILPRYWEVALKDAMTFPHWIKVDFGEGQTKAINKYRLRACKLVGFPRNWKLQASNNNHNWIDLHSVENFPISQIDYFETQDRGDWVSFYNRWLNATNIDWVPAQTWWSHWFTFTNGIFYRFYRLYVDVLFTVTNKTSPQLSVSQIELVEAEPVGGTTTTTTLSTTTVSTTTWTSTTQPPYYKNVTDGGYAAANHEYPSHDSSKAFDRTLETYWSCDPYSGPPYWIMYYWLDKSYAVDCYQIHSTTRGGPKTWKLRASNDGENWDILDEQTDVFIDGLWTGYMMNYKPYSFYQLYILETHSQAFGTRINDIQFYINSKDYMPEAKMHWVGYDFTPKKMRVDYYCIYLREGQGFDKWKLQASDDGILWTDIDFREEPNFVEWGCFEITGNQREFQKWRLLVMNWTRGTQPGLVELELYQAP